MTEREKAETNPIHQAVANTVKRDSQNPNYHPKPLFCTGEQYRNRNLSQQTVANLLLQNPGKEYIDGETVRCKRCGKIRGRIFWGTSNGGETYCGLPGHIGLLSSDPKLRAEECQCELAGQEQYRKKMSETEELHRKTRLTQNSGLPERYAYTTFFYCDKKSKEFQESKKRCQKYCANAKEILRKGSGLWIYGIADSGKTSLAVSMLHSLIDDHALEVIYTTPVQFSQELREAQSNRIPTAESVKRCQNAQFLIVDDFDVESIPSELKGGQWTIKELLRCLDSRFLNRLPTIICSRNKPDEMVKHMTDEKRTMQHLAKYSNNKAGAMLALSPLKSAENNKPEN